MKRQWYYRGVLKSCNYSCSYCPFSKKKGSIQEQQKDKTAFFRFINRLEEMPQAEGAVQVVPYGEALIHPYYWEGLAQLSRNPKLDLVGAQSNFSFPVEKMLSVYCRNGGDISKLRLWGTFHPEMTNVEQFVAQCALLSAKNITYCVGAVGVPTQFAAIHLLREALPPSVYLWINKMDGMKRAYTSTEIANFLKIDPYFEMELRHHRADAKYCADNRFVESDGVMHRCNLSRQDIGNLYDEAITSHSLICNRKECSCYLAYCNQMKELELLCFMPYPAFRIPVLPKAVFLDVDGTLLPEGETKIPERYIKWMNHLANYSDIYLATSLPYEIARKKTAAIWPLLSGGVFANGARMVIRKHVLDKIEPLDTSWIAGAKEKSVQLGFQLHTYQKSGIVYKVTLSHRKRGHLSMFSKEFVHKINCELGVPESCQILTEHSCIQITKKGTSKLAGVQYICGKMGYSRQETAVAGNSENDIPMLEYFPVSLAIS